MFLNQQTCLMQVAGSLAAMSAVTDRAVALSCSALLSGAARDALKSFFRSTQQGAAVLPHNNLRARLLEAGTSAPRTAQRSAAECVAALAEGSSDRVAETMRMCIASLEQASSVRLPSPAPRCLASVRRPSQGTPFMLAPAIASSRALVSTLRSQAPGAAVPRGLSSHAS